MSTYDEDGTKDKYKDPTKIDFTEKGPLSHVRPPYALNEFAAKYRLNVVESYVALTTTVTVFLTSLVMLKPGTEFRDIISPPHVSQLQCIIDAMS